MIHAGANQCGSKEPPPFRAGLRFEAWLTGVWVEQTLRTCFS